MQQPQQQWENAQRERLQRDRDQEASFQHTQLGVYLAGAFGLMYLWASSAQVGGAACMQLCWSPGSSTGWACLLLGADAQRNVLLAGPDRESLTSITSASAGSTCMVSIRSWEASMQQLPGRGCSLAQARHLEGATWPICIWWLTGMRAGAWPWFDQPCSC